MKRTISVALLVAGTVAAFSASAETIDFSRFDDGTAVSTVRGVSFSLSGGPTTATTPIATRIFGIDNMPVALTNSNTNDYPTSTFITALFGTSASNVSFTFNNFGTSVEGVGASGYRAYDASGRLLSAGFLGLTNDYAINNLVTGSGIKRLVFSNNSDGYAPWQFGIGSLSFTETVPEPATWLMMIVGIGAVGVKMRRRQKVTTQLHVA